MAKIVKTSACGDMKRHLRSQGADSTPEHDGDEGNRGASEQQPQDLSQDVAKIFAALTKISSDMGGLEEIRRATISVEAKLSTLLTRMDEVEKRVEYLEMAEKEWQDNPPASKMDVERLWDKVDDLENRSRRNNVRFIGFPEGKEGRDAAKFLEELIPELLDIEGRREIERAHRIAGPQPKAGRPRPLLAKFLRSSDRDAVLRAARNKGKLVWGNATVMLFPDYSRATQMKRDKFRECKKKLHDRKVSFRMLFPAKLIIDAKDGVNVFECPRKAMAFVDAMG